jgi:hypothetical protein
LLQFVILIGKKSFKIIIKFQVFDLKAANNSETYYKA